MDDDLRSRYRAPRRDYAGPLRSPAPRHRPAGGAARPAISPQAARYPAPRPPGSPGPPAAAKRRKPKRSVFKVLAGLVIIAGLAAGGFLGFTQDWGQNPFPRYVRTAAKLDLLYPVKLPAGYKVSQPDIHLSNGILIYDAQNPSGDRLVFTIQPKPSNFNFDDFYNQQLQSRQAYQTNFGAATIGKNDNRYLGSLVDGDTWLLLSTTTTDISRPDMVLTLTHLKQY